MILDELGGSFCYSLFHLFNYFSHRIILAYVYSFIAQEPAANRNSHQYNIEGKLPQRTMSEGFGQNSYCWMRQGNNGKLNANPTDDDKGGNLKTWTGMQQLDEE